MAQQANCLAYKQAWQPEFSVPKSHDTGSPLDYQLFKIQVSKAHISTYYIILNTT